MSVTVINKKMYHCVCEHSDCLYEWDSEVIPPRCAHCKRYTWNGVDKRRKEPVAIELPKPRKRSRRA
jgi:hypothetical protein